MVGNEAILSKILILILFEIILIIVFGFFV